jgi:hypothetical protein
MSIASRHFLTLGKKMCCTNGKFYLSLTLISSYCNPCWYLLNFSKNNNRWFFKTCIYPKTTLLLLKVEGCQVFNPHARGLASLLLKQCSPFLHTLRTLEFLGCKSFYKCYLRSTFASYYFHPKHGLVKGLHLFPNFFCKTFVENPIGF